MDTSTDTTPARVGNLFTLLILAAIAVIALILALCFAIIQGLPYDSPYNRLPQFIFWVTVMITPLLLADLYIRRRNYPIIQSMKAGHYWLKWEYSDHDRAQGVGVIPKGAREVLIGPYGAYYPAKKYTLYEFGGGLADMTFQVGRVDVLRCFYTQVESYDHTPQVSKLSGRVTMRSTAYRTFKAVDVPIPQGHETEARQFAESWRRKPITGYRRKRLRLPSHEVRMRSIALTVLLFFVLPFIIELLVIPRSY